MVETGLRLIDGWVNRNKAGSGDQPGVGQMFGGLQERRRRGTTLSELIDEMDAAGVDRAVLCARSDEADDFDWMREAILRHPSRFTGSIMVDPRAGMDGVRMLERKVTEGGINLVRVAALSSQLPYDHPFYFPIYSKCIELGIPIGVNVGIPGPRVPAKHQHPLSLDEVCCFFPELKVIMSHGGVPWAEECVQLMVKWENLHYMSSAYAPKYLPAPILEYLNGRGPDRIMWASDYPVLDFQRCRAEIESLPVRDESRRRMFAYENAHRLLFRQSSSDQEASSG